MIYEMNRTLFRDYQTAAAEMVRLNIAEEREKLVHHKVATKGGMEFIGIFELSGYKNSRFQHPSFV